MQHGRPRWQRMVKGMCSSCLLKPKMHGSKRCMAESCTHRHQNAHGSVKCTAVKSVRHKAVFGSEKHATVTSAGHQTRKAVRSARW
ncbi:hypothetical protein AMTR_s00082p00093820 [Amborella trichopoda]|uniref:Uncharacterized protein n=1 Tax=Amborella trichopoda TaxID=13333 RepID=W1NU35_AMBTC|nr:hypothetical protein AMTR_s00082p00093820 [Amborella trichopoda]